MLFPPLQCVPEMSEHEANTVAVILASKAMSHVEGGWPKDIDYSEAEHTIRYRKKVEKDEDYVMTVARLGGEVEELVKQNNAVDIYQVQAQARRAHVVLNLTPLADTCRITTLGR